MTATLNDVTKKKLVEQSAEQQAATELVRLARERSLSLTGPGGLLKQLTKTLIETALNEEMTEHLGYEKHDPAGAGTGNIRNGTRGPCGDARRLHVSIGTWEWSTELGANPVVRARRLASRSVAIRWT